MARREGRPPCSIDGCDRLAVGRGWCSMHWQRWRNHGSPTYERPTPPTMEERVWKRVDKSGPGGCWLWTGALFQVTGYGMLSVDDRPALAHRLSYAINVGPIADGLHLDHLCRVRRCVNPAHLEPVTIRTNLMRGDTTLAASNAAKTECLRGHPFTEENTYLYRGARMCRECRRQRWKADHPPTGAKKGRPFAAECNRGHPLSGPNLYVSPKGKRVCQACLAIRAAKAAGLTLGDG